MQINNFRCLLGIRRVDRVPNAGIRELCEMMKGVDEKIDEGVLWWVSHVERMENNRIADRVSVGSMLVVAQWVGRGRMNGLIP